RVSELFGCEDAVDWLLHQGSVSLVALTRGESGCTLATLRERVEHPGCRPSRVSDGVGAGDAFVAALIVELLRKTPLRSIALRANQYASWVVEKPGAMVPIPNAAHDLSLIDDMTSVSNL